MKLAEFLLIVGCVAVAKSASQSESNEATVSGPHSGSSELVPLSRNNNFPLNLYNIMTSH